MLKKLCYLFIFLTVETSGQKSGNLELNTGCGFYDAFNIGMVYHFNQKIGVGGSIGYDNRLLYHDKYISASAEFTLSILRKFKTKNNNCHFRLQNTFYFWWLEDRFYKFKVFTYGPCFVYRIDFSKRIYLSCNAGPAINFVVYNLRKTFEEVGWPHYVQFNPGIQLSYIFNK